MNLMALSVACAVSTLPTGHSDTAGDQLAKLAILPAYPNFT